MQGRMCCLHAKCRWVEVDWMQNIMVVGSMNKHHARRSYRVDANDVLTSHILFF